MCPAEGGDRAAGFGFCRILLGGQEIDPKEPTMATTPATWSREALAAAPQSYFDAVDAMDVDAVLAHFADDATLTVQTDHVTFDGAAEIRRMFTDFFAGS
jgi:hypothetical protein